MDNNTNPTAAQPLDLAALDKLEALARAATPGEWKREDRTVYVLEPDGWRKGIEQFRNRFSCSVSRDGSSIPQNELLANAEFIAAANPSAILALIAQARAAQPESATGTTGASRAEALRQEVCIMYQYLDDREWAEHIAVTPEGQCLETAITRLVSENADLRVQLAAKGQGDPAFWLGKTDVEFLNRVDGVAAKVTAYRKSGSGKVPYFSAPASAQPDRGAAAPVYAVGASASIEGIADELEAEALNYDGDFADTVKGCVEALRLLAASPASQPVAPTLMRQAVATVVSRVGNELRVGWLRPERCDVGTLLYCASEPSPASQPVAPALTDERIKELAQGLYHMDYQDDPHGYDIELARRVETAVAPSDAKGKEDAAIAGARVAAFKAAFHAAHRQGACYDDAVATGLSAADQFNVTRAADAANAGGLSSTVLPEGAMFDLLQRYASAVGTHSAVETMRMAACRTDRGEFTSEAQKRIEACALREQVRDAIKSLYAATSAANAKDAEDAARLPVGVCWSEQRCEFYRADNGVGMGRAFYHQWRDHADEFPDRDTARAAMAAAPSSEAGKEGGVRG